MRLIQGVQHREQPNEDSCAPGVLAMAGTLFGEGEHTTVGYWFERLNPNAEEGTDNDLLARITTTLYECEVIAPASWEQMRAEIDNGHPVVVNFLVREAGPLIERGKYVPLPLGNGESIDGHYALAVGYTSANFPDGEGLFVFDPKAGPEPVWMARTDFEARWRAHYTDYVRWMMAIRGIRKRIDLMLVQAG